MKTFKAVTNVILFFFFLIALFTGLAKFPELKKDFSFLYGSFSASQISVTHDWFSVGFVFLIAAHLLLNQKRIVTVYGGQSKPGRYLIGAAIFVPVLFVIAFALLFAKQFMWSGSSAKTLPAVEVKQYKGEKLDSINSFRENSIKGPQHVSKKTYRLRITGLVARDKKLDYGEVLGHQSYKKVVQLNCVEGWSAKVLWEGVLLKDLLAEANAKPGAKTVIFYAADGYSTSLPLKYILDKNILLAYRINGVTLPPERGFPFQLVAEQKWGYKWIKWVTKIELSDNIKFKGYWEKRGYNNNGDTSKPKFGK